MNHGCRWSTLDLPLLGPALKVRRVRGHLTTIRWALQATPVEIRAHQVARLKALLQHAYEQVPLYRRKWDACGVKPEAFQDLDDLSRFPCVTKQDFREAYPEDLCAASYRHERTHCLSTTGSTGSPVQVLYDRDRALLEIAVLSRASVEMALGVPLRHGLSILLTNRSAIETLPTMEFPQARDQVVDAMAAAHVHRSELNRRQPQYLLTYPSVLLNLAQLVQREGGAVHQPEYIVTTAETMTPTAQRAIRAVFKGELRDCYATTESGCIALTCARPGGFHILAYKAVVEIADEAGRPVAAGSAGRVVLTDLYNLATPVIRYTGVADISRLTTEPCSCALGHFPSLAALEGRTIDMVARADGGTVHPYRLTEALREVRAIRLFQVRQETLTGFRVLIVLDAAQPDAADSRSQAVVQAEVGRQLGAVLGDAVEIRTEFVETIPKPAGTHKHSPVVSLIR